MGMIVSERDRSNYQIATAIFLPRLMLSAGKKDNGGKLIGFLFLFVQS
jgi:hypothetical protein